MYSLITAQFCKNVGIRELMRYSSKVNPQLLDKVESSSGDTAKSAPGLRTSLLNDSKDQSTDAVESSSGRMNLSESWPQTKTATKYFDKINVSHLDNSSELRHPAQTGLSFNDVPGPRVLKYISQAWSYVPLVGHKVLWSRNIKPFDKMFDVYGPVVRLYGPFGGNLVLLNRPEHMEAVYKQEDKYPVRSTLDCIEHYRKNHSRDLSIGSLLTVGSDWETFRMKVESPLRKGATILHDKMEMACEELISRIYQIRNRQEEVPADFDQELFKWSLESLCCVIFSKRFGVLDPHPLLAHSEQYKLLEAMEGASTGIKSCETGLQLWRFYETYPWKLLTTYTAVIEKIISNHIKLAQNNLLLKKSKMENQEATLEEEHNKDLVLIETMLLKDNMHAEDVLTVLLDMMLVGVNSASNAMGFMMYHLSKSQRAQRILFEELKEVMPERNSKLSKEKLNKCVYLKACVKESLRMKPPFPVTSKVLAKDINLHSYSIPKGTYMIMANQIACLREENFEDANKFNPDRWLGSHPKDINPFATVPFGYGLKSGMSRETAEHQLWLLTAKLVRNFQIEYHYGDIDVKTKLFSEPSRTLKFRLVDRE